MEAYKTFVEERIIGRRNLWENMTKVKVLTSKATTSLFARLLVIARSSRECISGRNDRDA